MRLYLIYLPLKGAYSYFNGTYLYLVKGYILFCFLLIIIFKMSTWSFLSQNRNTKRKFSHDECIYTFGNY